MNATKIATVVGVMATGFAPLPQAYAWDAWPCEVLLCLANPAGPMAAPDCVPPIRRLYREMARPRFRMPVCQMVGYPDMSRFEQDLLRTLNRYREPTPDQLSAGMTQTPVYFDLPAEQAQVRYLGIAPLDPCEGGRRQVIDRDADGRVSGAECRGPLLGYTYRTSGEGTEAVPVYEGYRQRVHRNGVAFDIYIGGELWQRVRLRGGDDEDSVSYVGRASADGSTTSRFGVPAAQQTLRTFPPHDLPDNSVPMRSEADADGTFMER